MHIEASLGQLKEVHASAQATAGVPAKPSSCPATGLGCMIPVKLHLNDRNPLREAHVNFISSSGVILKLDRTHDAEFHHVSCILSSPPLLYRLLSSILSFCPSSPPSSPPPSPLHPLLSSPLLSPLLSSLLSSFLFTSPLPTFVQNPGRVTCPARTLMLTFSSI